MPYFVYIGRLVNFVRETGLIIQLFNHLKLPLVVIGSGPDEEELKAWQVRLLFLLDGILKE